MIREVPGREVEHGNDDEEEPWVEISGTGSATTLDMGTQAKAQARRKREKLERELGGFGFRGAT